MIINSTGNNKINARFAQVSDRDAIERFNGRMREGGRPERMPSSVDLLGQSQNGTKFFPVYRRLLLAEDGQEVRAGMVLKHNTIFIRGHEREFCWVHQPLSEGLIDRTYSLAIVQLVKSALGYQPFLMSLGVGSHKAEWARFMIKSGWRYAAVPFFFYPLKTTKVLLGLNYLKNSKLRLGASISAYCGLGAGLSGLFALRRWLRLNMPECNSHEESAFGDWADRIFANSLQDYGVVVRRDASTLNILYPVDDPRFIRLRIKGTRAGENIGWIVVANIQMCNDKYFGNLKLGVLVDGFSRLANVPALVGAGLDFLADNEVDLVVTNWSQAAWIQASRRLGFLPGPSTYHFFVARGTTPLLESSCSLFDVHLTRGDSDGMVQLRGDLSR